MINYATSKSKSITLIAVQKPIQTEIFDVAVTYGVGSVNETKDKAGISHALEHCVFLGSTQKTREQLEEKLLNFGGDFNASTGYESTGFILSGELNDLEDGVHTLYELSSQPALNPGEDFNTEKEVILSELEQDLDDDGNWQDPDMVSFHHLFKDTNIEWGPIGLKESVENFTALDLKNYHSKHYKTGQTCITVISSLPPQDALKRLEDLSVNYTDSTFERIVSSISFDQISNVRTVIPIKSASQSLDITFHIPYQKPKGFADGEVKIMSGLLFHSEMSLLFGETRKKGLAYSVGGNDCDIMGLNLYGLNININEENVKNFCKLFIQQINKLMSGEISTNFFNLVKKHRRYRCEKNKEQALHYANVIEDAVFLGRKSSLPEDLMHELKTTTIDMVAELSRTIFKSPKAVVTIKGPHQEDTRKLLQEVLDTYKKIQSGGRFWGDTGNKVR